MARAKRTERAEARRRYRAAMTAEPAADDHRRRGAVARQPAIDARSSSRTSSGDKAVPAGRMGFGEAFRASIRPMHVRADLASLPWIAVHTKALWVPVLITVASTIAVIGTPGRDGLAVHVRVLHPDAGDRRRLHRRVPGAAGELAARASSSGSSRPLCYSILVLGFPSTIYPAAPPSPDTGPRHRGLGVRPVAGHRRLLRRRRRLVSPLPRLLEPEPRPKLAEPEGDGPTGRRPDAQRDDARRRPAPSAEHGARVERPGVVSGAARARPTRELRCERLPC